MKITRKINFYRCFFGEEFSKHILLQFDCNSNVFFHVIMKFIKLCQPTQTYTHLHTSIIKQTTTLNKKQSLGKCFLTFFFRWLCFIVTYIEVEVFPAAWVHFTVTPSFYARLFIIFPLQEVSFIKEIGFN